jgi:hypothetical protein
VHVRAREVLRVVLESELIRVPNEWDSHYLNENETSNSLHETKYKSAGMIEWKTGRTPV